MHVEDTLTSYRKRTAGRLYMCLAVHTEKKDIEKVIIAKCFSKALITAQSE